MSAPMPPQEDCCREGQFQELGCCIPEEDKPTPPVKSAPKPSQYKRTVIGKLTVEIEGPVVDLWVKDWNGDESLATVDLSELLAALQVEADDPASHPVDCLCDAHGLEELMRRAQG